MRKFMVGLGMLIAMATHAQEVAKSLVASNGVFIGFEQFTPYDYASNPSTQYPLIIFLHGVGEKGDGTSQLGSVNSNGIMADIVSGAHLSYNWNGQQQSFIVLAPQLSPNYGDWQDFYIDEMIKYATQNLRVDPNRIILTGLSLGGGGTWHYSGESLTNAQKFAAVGISCGTCQSLNWCNFANAHLPVWAFHAQDDGTVPVGCTQGAISSILNCNPAVKPYMTIWPDGNHYIWGRVYDTGYTYQNPNIYEWFLAQNKSLPVNVRPIANGGPDLNTNTNTATITLNASGSRDPDGNIVRYIWTKISGPTFGNITTPVSTNGITTVTGLQWAGTYQYQVKVVDNRCDWTFDTVTVNVAAGGAVNNQAPIANAGAAISITLPTSNATLNGSASSDPDGTISSYSWTQISGPAQSTIANSSAATTGVSNLTTGIYTFQLTVTDNQGAAASSTVLVTVLALPGSGGGSGATANAGSDISITLPTNTTTLNGSSSKDPGGTIAAYQWSYISGPSTYSIASPSSASTALNNLVQGTYKFKLTIWDHNWVPIADTVVVTVNPAVVAPPPSGSIANAGSNTSITLPTNAITLNGSASTDPGGTIKAYQWSEVSGPQGAIIANASAVTTTVSNLVNGTYTFQLTVWDHNWTPFSATVAITVNPGTPNNPSGSIADAGGDITITLPNNVVTLNGSGSSDPGGTIKAYQWSYVSGPSQYNITNPSSATTTLSNLVAGVYSFQLMVWDHNWTPYADKINVTVNGGSGTSNSIANAGADVILNLPTNSTTLNGSGSSDPGGTIKAYKWTELNGPAQYSIANPTAATTGLSNLVQGVYSFQLMVWDHNWKPFADTVVIAVTNATTGTSSVANAGPDIYLTSPASSTTLNGSASSDPNGFIKGYLWTKLSGPSQYSIANSSAASTALTNLVTGVYSFQLTVWDNGWVPRTDTVMVVVLSSGGGATVMTGSDNSNGHVASEVQNTAVADRLKLYPNPARDMLNIQLTSNSLGSAIINIYTVTGQLAKKISFNKSQVLSQQSVNVGGLQPGVYLMEVMIDNKKMLSSKFIKQ